MTNALSLDQEVRARIVAGARRHFLAHGFRSVTMDDIAVELAMSKKTLYQHFSAKTDLLRAVLETKLAEAEEEVQAIADAGEDPFPERVYAMLECMRKNTSELSPAFIRDMGKTMPEMFAWVQDRRRGMIRSHWRRLFETGQKEKMIRSDLSMDLMITALCGAADAVVNPAKLEELGMGPRDAFGEIIRLFIEGAVTEKGRMQF